MRKGYLWEVVLKMGLKGGRRFQQSCSEECSTGKEHFVPKQRGEKLVKLRCTVCVYREEQLQIGLEGNDGILGP